MKNNKKTKLIFIVLVIIPIISTVNLFYIQANQSKISSNQVLDELSASSSQLSIPFKFGTLGGLTLPWGLDPHYAWDGRSIDVIDQVVETLFAYDLSEPESPIVPRLAKDYGTWSEDDTIYTVELNQGITFHDGTPFNASAVIWNFERLKYFMNLDEEHPLPPEMLTQISILYLWPDGTPIINTVQKSDGNDYIVEFVLNSPGYAEISQYNPFEALLCFSGSGFLSPTSTDQYKYEYIDTLTGDLVGTGPFVYDEYIEDTEVRFHAYENYWNGPAAIGSLTFSIYPSHSEATQALLDGNVDFIKSLDTTFLHDLRIHQDITLVDAGPHTTTRFLVMNNDAIEVNMRKAISYALDYNEVINQLEGGEAIRLRSPIPVGIKNANWDFNVPETNKVEARQALIDSLLYGPLIDAEADDWEWEDIAYGPTPVAEFFYTYNEGNMKRAMFFDILQNDLAKIGVRVIAEVVDFSEFWDRVLSEPESLTMFWLGWGADYNDPSDYINFLFDSEFPTYNFGLVDDVLVQQWMIDALSETNLGVREGIYDDIQQRLIEEVYPWCWGYVLKNYDAYGYKFKGFQSNALEKVYFYPVTPSDTTPSSIVQFKYGTRMGPTLLDPHLTWSVNNFDVFSQVIETLYAYDLSDPELQPIPRLASDYGEWRDGGLTYRVPLREGVTFHDRTPFNAKAVKWNFDRLKYFMDLDTEHPLAPNTPRTEFSGLYLWPDSTPIIDSVNVIDEFTVDFVLNSPYAPLEALLSFYGSGLLSPISTTMHTYIDTLTGDLVGTGPFVFDEYIEDTEVRFHAYQNYWREPSKIDLLTFSIYSDPYWRTQALLDGYVDLITDFDNSRHQEFIYDPDITLVDAVSNAVPRFLVMNNDPVEGIEVNMRKAISYALDYNEVINQLEGGEAIRLRSPLPLGIKYANWDFNAPETNKVEARQALIDSLLYGPLPGAEAEDWEWEDIAYGPTPLGEFTYIYNEGNTKRAMLFDILQNDLAKIGVRVIGEEISWFDFITRLISDKNAYDLCTFGWIPDFNDPSNIINTLFNSEYDSMNFGQVHDDDVQQWMIDALSETDPEERRIIYDNIQQRLIEEVFPYCWLYVERNYDAYNNEFQGFPSNPLSIIYFYPVSPSDTMVPSIIYDNIPNEVDITYTKTPQIVGAIKIHDFSRISYAGFAGYPDPGFSLITNYINDEEGQFYQCEVIIMTTEQLVRGTHSLKIMIWDEQGNFVEKTFVVNVYRNAELKLSGEFDYLEKEEVKIAIAAQLLDAEDKFLVDPNTIGLTVYIRIVDYDGHIKAEEVMSYDQDGFFHWETSDTIRELKDEYTKGIYRVQGWVEFSPSSYYIGGNDVIEFHIDPPGEIESIPWLALELFGFGGLTVITVVVAIYFLRERRRRIGLK